MAGLTTSAVNVSPMKKFAGMALLFLSGVAFAQPIRDINHAYLYNPDEIVAFSLKAVRGPESFAILYNLQVSDTAALMTEYSIVWEGRDLLSDKEGTPLRMSDHVVTVHRSGLSGRAAIMLAGAPKYLVAKVVKNSIKRAWLFYTPLEENFPVNGYLTRGGMPVMEPFVHTDDRVRIASDSANWIVSWYSDDFPAAAPVFSEGQARVSRGMDVDSVYTVRGGEELALPKKGLFLVQQDTTSGEGFSFRAEEDYPQFVKLASLPGPLVYITTRQEYERLSASRGNKKAFDRVILSMTADTDRARTLMRSYFRRVELANRYFTSYKEGWKTDRGMVYIIFGRPSEVFKFDDREVWNYDNDQFDIRFTFTRSASLFDPDNYVLIREKKHENTWYEVIDLWRNARF